MKRRAPSAANTTGSRRRLKRFQNAGTEALNPSALAVASWITVAGLTVLPAAAILARSFYLARGEIQATATLMVSLNLTALLLSSLGLLVQVGMPALFLVCYRSLLIRNKGRDQALRALPNGIYGGSILVLLLLAIFSTTVWYFTVPYLIGTLVLAFLTSARFGFHRKAKHIQERASSAGRSI